MTKIIKILLFPSKTQWENQYKALDFFTCKPGAIGLMVFSIAIVETVYLCLKKKTIELLDIFIGLILGLFLGVIALLIIYSGKWFTKKIIEYIESNKKEAVQNGVPPTQS